jgi:hypothetical protein
VLRRAAARAAWPGHRVRRAALLGRAVHAVHRSSTRPIAIAELRYNDAAGLIALGIPVQPVPDADEISTRETADPFPGDRFARPPAGIR